MASVSMPACPDQLTGSTPTSRSGIHRSISRRGSKCGVVGGESGRNSLPREEMSRYTTDVPVNVVMIAKMTWWSPRVTSNAPTASKTACCTPMTVSTAADPPTHQPVRGASLEHGHIGDQGQRRAMSENRHSGQGDPHAGGGGHDRQAERQHCHTDGHGPGHT